MNRFLKITSLIITVAIVAISYNPFLHAAGITVTLNPNEVAPSSSGTLTLTFLPATVLNNGDTVTISYPYPDVYDDSALTNPDIGITKVGDPNFQSGTVNVNTAQNLINIQLVTLGALDLVSNFEIAIDNLVVPSSAGTYSIGITTSVGDRGAALHYVGDSNDVVITASVSSCILHLKIYPEKRIPAVNNWQTQIDVEIYDNLDTFYGDFSVTSDNLGDATVNLCDEGIILAPGSYDFYIKGYSHLRKEYTNLGAFDTAESTIDFTIQGELFAGETSIVYDNYINTLDISTQVTRLETIDNKNDLNQDGEVNTLDVSNTITNFYISGDCSPQEIIGNVCN